MIYVGRKVVFLRIAGLVGVAKMSCLGGAEDESIKEQKRQNKMIDQQLRKDKKAYRALHRLLLLGESLPPSSPSLFLLLDMNIGILHLYSFLSTALLPPSPSFSFSYLLPSLPSLPSFPPFFHLPPLPVFCIVSIGDNIMYYYVE